MQKNIIIDCKSKALYKARNNALAGFYSDNGDTEQLALAGLNMYVSQLSKKHERKNFKNEIYSIIAESRFNPNVVLHPQQLECLRYLEEGNNLLLSAPTSFGKTFVALEYIARNDFNNIVFVVPTLALMTELSRKIYKRFGSEYTIITSANQKSSNKNIFVIVPERVDGDFLDQYDNIDLLVFDEIYKLHKKDSYSDGYNDTRIIALNKSYLNLLQVSNQIILLGPYIKDVRFNGKLENNIVKYYSDYAPVYINCQKIDSDMNEFVVNELKNDRYKMVYFSTPNDIYKFCEKQLKNLPNVNNDKLAKWCDKNILKGWLPAEMLRKGVCIHFAPLPTFFKKYVEYKYGQKVFHNVLCTSTLLEGINTPAEELIIYGHDDLNNSFRFNNLLGRVGRLDTFKEGIVYYFEDKFKSYEQDELKYIDLEIVAESREVNDVDEVMFLDKDENLLSPEEKDVKHQLDLIMEDYKIDTEEFKKRQMVDIKEFIKFESMVKDILSNLAEIRLIRHNYSISKKEKFKEEQNYVIKLYEIFLEVIKFEKKYLIQNFNTEISKYNDAKNAKLHYLSLARVLDGLLNRSNNIYINIGNILSPYRDKINSIELSKLIEGLFNLAFNYIKYGLAKILGYWNILMNDDYLEELTTFERECIDIFNNRIAAAINARNFDNDPILKILDEIGVPGTDLETIKGIIAPSIEGKESFSKVIAAIRQNSNVIFNNEDISSICLDILSVWND